MAEHLNIVHLPSSHAASYPLATLDLGSEPKSEVSVHIKQGKETEDEAAYGSSPILPVVSSSPAGPVHDSRWTVESISAWMGEEVDRDAASGPLAAFCFMTVTCPLQKLLWKFSNTSPHRDMCARNGLQEM